MSDYGLRTVELLQTYERVIASLPPQQAPEPGVFNATRASLQSYAALRERALGEAFDRLTIPDASATADSAAAAWSKFFADTANNVAGLFNELLRPPVNGGSVVETWLGMTAISEHVFWVTMGDLALPRFLGQARQSVAVLGTESKSLSAKWEQLTGQSERSNAQIANLRVQILDLFRNEVSDARTLGQQLEKTVQETIDTYMKTGLPLPEVVKSILKVLEPITKSVNTFRLSLDDLVKSSLGEYGGLQTYVELYVATCAAVKTYLEESYQKFYNGLGEAGSKTREAAERAGSPASCDDAKRFVAAFIDKASSVTRDFETAFGDFANQHETRFTKDISDATLEAMLHQSFFDKFWGEITSLDLPASFKQLDETVTRCEEFRADEITEEQRAQLKEQIKSALEPIIPELRQIDKSYVDRLRDQFLAPVLLDLKEKMKSTARWRK